MIRLFFKCSDKICQHKSFVVLNRSLEILGKVSPPIHVLDGGHLADLLTGKKGENGLRPSEIVKDEFAEGGPELIDR